MADPRSKPKQPKPKTAAPPPVAAGRPAPPPQQPVRRNTGRGR